MMPSILEPADRLSQVLRYAADGWHIFPVQWVQNGKCSCGNECGRVGKHPLTKHGYLDATTDRLQLEEWWGRWPAANIGLATGKSGVVALDIDPRNDGDASLGELEAKNGGLPRTRTNLTGGGGQHYIFHVVPGEPPPRSWKPAQGVEVVSDTGYIILPPSSHLLGTYRWDVGQPDKPAAAPKWITESPKRAPGKKSRSPSDGIIGSAFMAAGWCGQSLGHDKVAVRCPWAEGHSCGQDFDGSTVVFGPSADSPWGWFYCSHSSCQVRFNGMNKSERWRLLTSALPPAAVEAARVAVKGAQSAVAVALGELTWQASIRWNAAGTGITNDIGNLSLLLQNLPEWQHVFRYDESRDHLFWAEEPPLLSGLAMPHKGDPIRDIDYIYISQWFSMHREWGARFKKETIQDAVQARGWANRYNSLTIHLDSLEWDGISRLSNWLSIFLGVKDSPYSQFVGRAWLVSAMARAYNPGCKVDHLLVLEGRQGVGKTTTFELLGREWYVGSIPAVDSKDARGILASAWIAEFSELSAMRGVEIGRVKTFITERYDVYRPPYGRTFVRMPRHCVFAGTTNDGEWINDSTGGRRFWPIHVQSVAFEKLTRHRDNLLAEARHAYQAGEAWHPTAESKLQGLIVDEQSSRLVEDPWLPIIRDYIVAKQARDPEWMPAPQALFVAVGLNPEKQDVPAARRVGAVLRRLGWMKHRNRANGRSSYGWYHNGELVGKDAY